MNILGISASPSDHGFCYLQDGVIQSDVQVKSLSSTDFESFLQEAGIALADIDLLALCDVPKLQWQQIVRTSLLQVPEGVVGFLEQALPWVRRYAWLKKNIGSKSIFHGETLSVGRHNALAAGAFFQSGFQHAALLSFDTGVERTVSSLGVGSASGFSVLAEQYYPHSIELFYLAFMSVVGVPKGDVEAFKALASTGNPHCTDVLLSEFMDLKEDGSFRLDMDYFEYHQGLTVSSLGMSILREAVNTEKDIARSVQAVAELAFLRTLNYLHKVSGESRLCLSADGLLQCLHQKELLQLSPFDEVSVQTVRGGATGAALFAWHKSLQQGPDSI